MDELKNEVLDVATEHIRQQRYHIASMRVKCICVAVVLIVALVCGTILAAMTIREQQYALNMQYSALIDYVSGTDVVTETEYNAESSGDGSISVAGENNTMIGGDMNGK